MIVVAIVAVVVLVRDVTVYLLSLCMMSLFSPLIVTWLTNAITV